MTTSVVNDDNWVEVTYRNSLVFGLTACSEATVLLSATMYNADDDTFKVGIGWEGNTRSVIERGGKRYISVETPGILSCKEGMETQVKLI